MISLHLIRHGETVWHADNRYAGSSDVALTDRGLTQAAGLEEWGRRHPLAAVVSSDLSRARITGAHLAAGAGCELRVDPRLREVDFGEAEGLTRIEMHERFPDALQAFLERPATCPLPGGESGHTALSRGIAAIADIARDLSDGSAVGIVAHTTMIRLLLCCALSLPADDYRRRFPSLGNTTITTLALPQGLTASQYPGAGALTAYNCPIVP